MKKTPRRQRDSTLMTVRKRKPLRPGERVMIVDSWHSDIVPGAIGTIVRRLKKWYGVEITGLFYDAFGKSKVETRCVYFSARALQRLVRHAPVRPLALQRAERGHPK